MDSVLTSFAHIIGVLSRTTRCTVKDVRNTAGIYQILRQWSYFWCSWYIPRPCLTLTAVWDVRTPHGSCCESRHRAFRRGFDVDDNVMLTHGASGLVNHILNPETQHTSSFGAYETSLARSSVSNLANRSLIEWSSFKNQQSLIEAREVLDMKAASPGFQSKTENYGRGCQCG